MTPGALIYQVRNRLKHGLRVAYARDILRVRILDTAPIAHLNDDVCSIHVLTSDSDWLNLIWTLKSFYRVSERRYRLTIHDDGSLKPEARDALGYHFPDARIILREEADAAVLPSLAEYPLASAFRTTNKLSLKVFDFRHFLESDRMLLLDSDVLFFDTPRVLIDRIENPSYRLNTVNADVDTALTVDRETARAFADIDLLPRFNSGLGLIHRDSLRLDWIEEFLALPGVIGHFWRIEQTLFALCSSRFGAELLPDEYDVRLEKNLSGLPSRHYVGAIRHLMYGEGMRTLQRDGMLAFKSQVKDVQYT